VATSFDALGWRALLQPILEAAAAARLYPDYDEASRAEAVGAELAKVWKAPGWLPLLALPALLLAHGRILALGLIGLWLFLSHRSKRRVAERQAILHRETEVERSKHREAARAFLVEIVEAANRGELRAQERLRERWHSLLPPVAQSFSVQLSRASGGECRITGRAIGPDDIPNVVPRLGRGGRIVHDKRKVGDVDEDLTELNAATALSLLLAICGDADRVYVHLSVRMAGTPAGDLPWLRLAARVGYAELQGILARMEAPSEAIAELGGTVGRRRGKKFYPAEDPFLTRPRDAVPDLSAADSPSREVRHRPEPQALAGFGASVPETNAEQIAWTKATPQRHDGIGPDPEALRAGKINPEREGKVLEAIRGGKAGSTVQSLMAFTGLREPTVRHFGISASQAGLIEAIQVRDTYYFVVRPDDDEASADAMGIRAAILSLQKSERPKARAPVSAGRESEGLTTWRRLDKATFAPVGIESVSEVTSSPAEKVTAPPAGGEHERGDPKPRDMRGPFGIVAKRWANYDGDPSARFIPFHHYYPTYESLDPGQLHCYFGWRKAFRAGQTPPTDLSYLFLHVYELIHVIGVPDLRHAASELERLWAGYRPTYAKLDNYLVPWIADLYALEGLTDEVASWYRRAVGTGATIPDRETVTDLYWAVADYSGMPRLALATLTGEPKLGSNKFCLEHNLDGWVERGYREALKTVDEAFRAKSGKRLRDATIEASGLKPLTREAFAGAVYDWKRVRVTIAQLPNLDETSLAVCTFQSAVRYAENRMREQRKFRARLRGVEIDSDLAAAIDQRLADYVRATRPRTRVTIDLAKAKELEQESSEVRDILLRGLENGGDSEAGSPAFAPSSRPDGTPAGLLTDLAAVQSAISCCSVPARAVLDSFVAIGWEVEATDARLSTPAGGALVSPLIDEINGHSVTALGDLLIVPEGDLYVVQEDFRDEVYCVVRGSLEGFGVPSSQVSDDSPTCDGTPEPEFDNYGFGPAEVEALRLLSSGVKVDGRLGALAQDHGGSTLLFLERINELALASPHGDLIVDAGQDPPALIEDAREWVTTLLGQFPLQDISSPSLIDR
jgi:hypothetical protein